MSQTPRRKKSACMHIVLNNQALYILFKETMRKINGFIFDFIVDTLTSGRMIATSSLKRQEQGLCIGLDFSFLIRLHQEMLSPYSLGFELNVCNVMFVLHEIFLPLTKQGQIQQ